MVTNDDKLRRLRDDLVSSLAAIRKLRDEFLPGGRYASNNDSAIRLREEDVRINQLTGIVAIIDLLLNEPPSPAPAAAPSEGESALQPCPFCGSTASVRSGSGAYEGGFFIECNDGRCGATTKIMFACKDDPVPYLREMWNARTAAPAASPPVTSEAIEEFLTKFDEALRDRGCFYKGIFARLRALISTAIAEARGSSGLREAATHLDVAMRVHSTDAIVCPLGLMWAIEQVRKALAADAKEQPTIVCHRCKTVHYLTADTRSLGGEVKCRECGEIMISWDTAADAKEQTK